MKKSTTKKRVKAWLWRSCNAFGDDLGSLFKTEKQARKGVCKHCEVYPVEITYLLPSTKRK